MTNNPFCKVAILLFCSTIVYEPIKPITDFSSSSINQLLKQRHSHELDALSSEKLHIGNSLMPKVSLSLGQTISSHEPDSQTWGSFSVNSSIINFAAKPKLEIANLSIAQAKLKHQLELHKLERSQLKDLLTLAHLKEQKAILCQCLKTSQKLDQMRSKELEIGVCVPWSQEESLSTKFANDMSLTEMQINFYQSYLPEFATSWSLSLQSLFCAILAQANETNQIYQIGSKLLELQTTKLELEQDYWRKQYLPTIDFGLSLSNNRLYFFDRDWNARAGITLKWNILDFGSNSSQASAFENRSLAVAAEAKIAQDEEKRTLALNLINTSAAHKKFYELSKKLNQNTSKLASLKKLNKNGKISKKGYLLSKQATLADQLEILLKQLHYAIKALE